MSEGRLWGEGSEKARQSRSDSCPGGDMFGLHERWSVTSALAPSTAPAPQWPYPPDPSVRYQLHTTRCSHHEPATKCISLHSRHYSCAACTGSSASTSSKSATRTSRGRREGPLDLLYSESRLGDLVRCSSTRQSQCSCQPGSLHEYHRSSRRHYLSTTATSSRPTAQF